MSNNKTPLQQHVAKMFSELGISQRFMDASDHDYHCRCNLCKEWWQQVGQDPDNEDYGPFTKEEILGNDADN